MNNTLPQMIVEKNEGIWALPQDFEVYPWGKQPHLASIRVCRPYDLENPRQFEPPVIMEGSRKFSIEEAERQIAALQTAVDIAKAMQDDVPALNTLEEPTANTIGMTREEEIEEVLNRR